MTARLVVAAVATAVFTVGCAATPSSPPSDSLPPGPSSGLSPSPTISGPSEPVPTRPFFPVELTAVDRSLLGVLPPTVGGLALEAAPEAEAEIAADPDVAALFERFASAIAVDTVSGDFVFVTVLAARAGLMDGEVFRSYRDSFDEGACSQAGGVAGNAQAFIGDHTVFIGSCEGGVRTHHTWIEDRDLIVSISSVGAARLGEAIMSDLR